MGDVYDVFPLLANIKFAVSSVAALGSRLYVGGEDGSLRVLAEADGEAPVGGLCAAACVASAAAVVAAASGGALFLAPCPLSLPAPTPW